MGYTWVRIGWNVGFTVGVFAGGLILPVLAAPVAIGTTVGAHAGSRLRPRPGNRLIRWVFLAILTALAVETIAREAIAL